MEKNPKIPANYQTVMPYLIVKGATQFIWFMKTVFGADETYKAMRDADTIMHGELMIGGSTIMFADSTQMYDVRNAGMFIYVDDPDATFQKALDAGATIVTALADQSYGRSGGIKDPFGNTWWITGVVK